ncbi:MAG: 3-phosphoshikimate 1-carboxyvinyltransferase [Christensenellaceae bacterium]|nr:3-phosphoshikimate 1-carboxyvinyltransferase [Christensenellaceae bacterium]
MSLIISPSKGIKGIVSAPPSKSFLQRAIICSAFSYNPVVIKNFYNSEDVRASIDFVRSIGAKIEERDREIVVYPINISALNREKIYRFVISESGFVLRCALAICSFLGINSEIVSSENLKRRPNDGLIQALAQCGSEITETTFGYKIFSKVKSYCITVDASKSSQCLSALMIASYAARQTKDIKLLGNLPSKGYVEITKNVLRDFGATIEEIPGGYRVSAENISVSPTDYYPEGDWSNGAALLAFGLLYGQVSVKGLNLLSVQPDRKFVDVLKRAGGKIYNRLPCDNTGLCAKKATFTCSEDNALDNRFAFTAYKSSISFIDANIDECIDLFPTLAVICSFAKNVSIIRGVGRLKYKESDRLSVMCDLLRRAGGKIDLNGDEIKIYPFEVNPLSFDCSLDHRIAMAAILLSTKSGGRITGENSLNKSFPDFIDIYKLLGGDLSAT